MFTIMRLRPQGLLLLSFLISLVLWLYLSNFAELQSHQVRIQRILKRGENIVVSNSYGVSHSDNGMYVCATMDWWPNNKCDQGICSWMDSSILNVDLNNSLLKSAAKNLAPFYLRIGGSLSDQIVYDVPGQTPQPPCMNFKKDEQSRSGFSGGCLSMQRWEEICDFCAKVGCKIIFSLNYLNGRQNDGKNEWSGKWDPSNTMAFLNYTSSLRLPAIAGFELGNQLTDIILAKEYANDFNLLSSVTQKLWPDKSMLLLGPDSVGFDNAWISEFIDNLEPGTLDGITYHKYQLGPGDKKNLEDVILDVNQLDDFYNFTQQIRDVVLYNRVGISGVWVGEAGGAWNSGQHGTTNAFISGIWYNDELGAAAENLHNVFCRQTLVGGNYGLLKSTTFEPNPDYYSAFLWHQFMGDTVLKTTHRNGNSGLRIYAHCNQKIFGSITLLIINVKRKDIEFFVEVEGMDVKQFPRREYHLTAQDDKYNQQIVFLNGQDWSGENFDLRKIEAKLTHGNKPIKMAPISFAFVELLGLNLDICKKST